MTQKRRNFLKKLIGTSAMSVLGTEIVFSNNMPKGYSPVILNSLDDNALELLKKNKEMTILSDRPWNVEAPAHLLDDEVTPLDKMFVRNNGNPPENIDIKSWTLTIEGESAKTKKTFTLEQLKKQFKQYRKYSLFY